MQIRHLTSEEIRETLDRARQIAEQSGAPPGEGAEIASFLNAAEEMGIPPEATLQALRERMVLSPADYAPGQMVFTRSADGNYYPATIREIGEHSLKVEFVSGAHHEAPLCDVRPLDLLPGRLIQAEIKDWGWYNCRVERFDADDMRVHVIHDDFTETKERVSLRKVRLPESMANPARSTPAPAPTWRSNLLWAGIGLLAGLMGERLLSLLLSFLHF